MRNLYKKNNIFICKHDIHKHFSSKISVYHILEKKKCYPDGCVYFKWKCKVLAKKKKCHRNFTKVGKNCFSCKYFYEEKIHQFPQIVIDQNEKTEFEYRYAEFCDWINSLKDKRVFCEAIIDSIAPDFVLYNNNGKYNIGLRGFLLIFKEGFIDDQHFEDTFFLHLNSNTQNKFRFREEDELEFKANVKIVDGKLELFSAGSFNFYLRGKTKPLLKSDLLVSISTATTFAQPYPKCHSCKFSILPKIQNVHFGKKRVLVCTKGINEPDYCVERLEKKLQNSDKCENDMWEKLNCNHTL